MTGKQLIFHVINLRLIRLCCQVTGKWSHKSICQWICANSKSHENCCNWHTKIDSLFMACMVLFSSFVEWTAIVMVCLIFLAVCLSLCTLLQNVQIAYSKVQNRPQPNDRFYCWLNVTARRQSNINHCTWWVSRERWLASCRQFNSGSKIVLFMCLFPYWFDCWFGLNGFGWDWDWMGFELWCHK